MENLKKIIGIFCVLSLVCLNVTFATTGTVNTPAARIREKASTDSEVITKVYEDEEVEILGEEGDWYKVKVNGKTGYVSKSLIKTSGNTINTDANANTNANTNTNTASSNSNSNNANSDSTSNNRGSNNVSIYATEESQNTEFKNVISKDTVLRLLPNFASNELRVLTKDTEVKIEKELNNWTKITLLDNSTGWVLKNDINYAKVGKTVEEQVKKEEQKDNTTQNTATTDTSNTIDSTNTEVINTEISNTIQDNNITTDNKTTSVKNAIGKVNVETANVREKASKTSDIIERLDEGDEVTIVEEEGDWYKITSSKVSSGYVSKSLITVSSSEVSSRSLAEPREEETTVLSSSSTSGEAIVEFAKQFLGTSYVLGGKTPETGFDCSGFTRYVFKNFGYSLETVASEQVSIGVVVERSDLKPGDLILFQNDGKTKIGHTGIYIGNSEFIHAANPERGVVIDNLVTMQYYNERFVTARRIVE